MFFNIEHDDGRSLSGYVVCDGFDESVPIRMISGGEVVYAGAADHLRMALVVAGRHRTGLCGFALDETTLPGLPGMADLEIYIDPGDMLVYRRPRPEHVQKKVLRLETHLFPLWRLDNVLNPRFQYHANQIESCGRETTTQMFLLNRIPSVYLSGRLLYRAFQNFIDGHFEVAFTMHHPYEELAERLIMLAQIERTGSGILGLRENMSLKSTMAFAQSLPLDDERALGRALRNIPQSVARVLANPVTRQLTTSTPDEMPSGSGLSSALTALASFHVVGLRRAPGLFASAISELTEIEAGNLASELGRLPGVTSLARTLMRAREAEWLIEQDLALYRHIATAFRGTDVPRPSSAI